MYLIAIQTAVVIKIVLQCYKKAPYSILYVALCVMMRLSVPCHTLSGISVAPALSSSFTVSKWLCFAAKRSAVIPFCMVEK